MPVAAAADSESRHSRNSTLAAVLSMPVQVELVHAEPGRRVVLARHMEGDTTLAMALGEGASAEEAEDRARGRLQAQPKPAPISAPTPVASRLAEAKPAAAKPAAARPAAASVAEANQPHAAAMAEEQVADSPPDLLIERQREQTSQQHDRDLREPEAPQEPPADPEDWSGELASLDLQLKRLAWGREQEATFLLRAFGHGSRSRLTTYADLLAYLKALEGFSPGADPVSCPIPLKRSDLLSQSDQLLAQLGWTADRGRQLLEAQFGRNSRQQLSDAQLLEFNMLLESEVLAAP